VLLVVGDNEQLGVSNVERFPFMSIVFMSGHPPNPSVLTLFPENTQKDSVCTMMLCGSGPTNSF